MYLSINANANKSSNHTLLNKISTFFFIFKEDEVSKHTQLLTWRPFPLTSSLLLLYTFGYNFVLT